MADNTIRQQIQNILDNSSARRAFFVVLAGKDIGKTYELGMEPLIIGRQKECSVFVDDEEVSRQHAKVTREPEGVFVYDLESTNGTLVNGEQVQRCQLADGDRVQIGNDTVLKFNYQDELESAFNEELYNSANRDFLTGVYNKKYFLDRLRMEFSFSKRHDSELSLIMFDVDHFKQINDNHGHLVGDEILKLLCQRVVADQRAEDVFARFGGEEFVLLLRATNGERAYIIAEKMRRLIAEKPFAVDEREIDVTISLGITSLVDQDPANLEAFLLQADNQLYRAKRGGRNQTCK